VDPYEQVNESSVFIKCLEFLEELRE